MTSNKVCKVASAVFSIQQVFNFEPFLAEVPFATPWFTNAQFEELNVHFRLLLSHMDKSRYIMHVQMCTRAQRDYVMMMETEKHELYHRLETRLPGLSTIDPGQTQQMALLKMSVEVGAREVKIKADTSYEKLPSERSLSKFFPVSLFKSAFKMSFSAEFFLPRIPTTLRCERVVAAPTAVDTSSLLSELHDGLMQDVVLRVERGRELPAHRCVLAANSPVFRQMFRHDLRERQLGVVDVKKPDNATFVSAEVMEAALRHMYGKPLGQLDANTQVDLLVLANQYELKELKALCEEVLIKDSTLDALELVTVAHDHRAEHLMEATIDRLMRSHTDKGSLYNSASFKEIMRSRPDIVEELFKRL